MIPVGDTIPRRSFPIINYLIIGVNAIVFFYEMSLGKDEIQQFFHRFALVPAQFSQITLAANLWPFLTNTFLHGGLMHFLGNMWTLYIFGDNVEDRMGSFGYLTFYLICGVGASFTHYFLNMSSEVPALGASGAISGVMAAYMFLFPQSRIIFLVPLFFLPFFIEVYAFFYIGAWFFMQFFSGTVSAATGGGAAGGVAFWAHIGGFLIGLFMYRLFARRKDRGYEEDEDRNYVEVI